MKTITRHRAFLVLLVLGISLLIGRNSFAGMLTYTFDDAMASVHTHALPVLSGQGQTATVGVIASQINTDDPAYMNQDQLLELQAAGWEIASHGMTHQRPADIPLYYKDEVLEGWAPVRNSQNVYQLRYKYKNVSVLLANDQELKEVDNFNEVRSTPGSYYLSEIIGQLYVNLPGGQNPKDVEVKTGSYQRELEYSHDMLRQLGFNVTDYITPYNYWTGDMELLSRKYYECVASANNKEHSNYSDHFEKYYLTRMIIHHDTPAEQVIGVLKEVQRKNGWLILCLHGVEDEVGYEPWPVAELDKVARWVTRNGVDVVNLREGWKALSALKKAKEVVPAPKPTTAGIKLPGPNGVPVKPASAPAPNTPALPAKVQ